MRLPALYDDTVIVDEPRVHTQIYDSTMRSPAIPLWIRFAITAGFLYGAPTDAIAVSLAAGCRWKIGSAAESTGHSVIWLLPMDVPYEAQIAAWWIGGPQ